MIRLNENPHKHLVTNFVSKKDLDLIMENPQFGSFDGYVQNQGMIIETYEYKENSEGSLSPISRFWKFTVSDDDDARFEVREVTRNGVDLNNRFIVE